MSKCTLKYLSFLELKSDKISILSGFVSVKPACFTICDMWHKENLDNVKAFCNQRGAILTKNEDSTSHKEG